MISRARLYKRTMADTQRATGSLFHVSGTRKKARLSTVLARIRDAPPVATRVRALESAAPRALDTRWKNVRCRVAVGHVAIEISRVCVLES